MERTEEGVQACGNFLQMSFGRPDVCKELILTSW